MGEAKRETTKGKKKKASSVEYNVVGLALRPLGTSRTHTA